MAADATITLEFMQAKLEEEHGVHVNVATVHRRLAGFHFSFKVLKKQAAAAVTKERFEEAVLRLNIPNPIIVMDNVGFHHSQIVI